NILYLSEYATKEIAVDDVTFFAPAQRDLFDYSINFVRMNSYVICLYWNINAYNDSSSFCSQ
ncbi:hypothetical protein, partial [Acinetobacter baumannii]|uniref:hypothetical protein n=1 Tax=Acinetobacter baumannii TaxID=470 RepID=UPI001C0791A4